MSTLSTFLDALLAPAFLVVLALWVAASIGIAVAGIRAGRRRLVVRRVVERLRSEEQDPKRASEAVVGEVPIATILKVVSAEGDGPLARDLSRAAVARWGSAPFVALAGHPSSPRASWKRIASFRVLLHAGYDGLVDLLAAAVDDAEPEIVGAAVALLGTLPDRRAGEVLVRALKDGKYTASRIATRLDAFPVDIGAEARTLLHHPDPAVRYWGATLMAGHAGQPGLAEELTALTSDRAPLVRKAAVASLAAVAGPAAADALLRRLDDETWYVRAHAARALAASGHGEAAERIAPLLADREWWVRLAAKEALQALGDEVWSVLVPYLDHADAFARNGAAEVLQNLGVLDSLIVLEAATTRPSPAKIEMLRKIAAAGGSRMTEALLDRVDAQTRPRVRSLLANLGLEPAGAAS